jgi:hypothetical protein
VSYFRIASAFQPGRAAQLLGPISESSGMLPPPFFNDDTVAALDMQAVACSGRTEARRWS